MRGVGGRLRSLRIGCLWRERIAARSEGQISKRRVWALLVVVPAPSRDPWRGCHGGGSRGPVEITVRSKWLDLHTFLIEHRPVENSSCLCQI